MGQNGDRIGTKIGKNDQKSPEFSTLRLSPIRLSHLFAVFNFFHRLCGTAEQHVGRRDTGVKSRIYNNKVSHLTVPPGTVGTEQSGSLESGPIGLRLLMCAPTLTPRTKRTTPSRRRSSNCFTRLQSLNRCRSGHRRSRKFPNFQAQISFYKLWSDLRLPTLRCCSVVFSLLQFCR
jgi:hypothetical protein